ncbi:MAG: hypothetical protein LC715_08845, partial [Gammaproteobacteria bacterium]|nr:hypothetical protein [Gammaproteobacteria bacterium]
MFQHRSEAIAGSGGIALGKFKAAEVVVCGRMIRCDRERPQQGGACRLGLVQRVVCCSEQYPRIRELRMLYAQRFRLGNADERSHRGPAGSA